MSDDAGGDSSGGRRAKHLSPKGTQLHRSLLESLNERDRANFAQILEYYRRTKNVQRLVESLNEICRTPQQREDIYPLLRAFIPRNDRERFDYECHRPRSAYGRRQYHTYSKHELSKYHTTRSLPEDLPYRWSGSSSGLGTPPPPSSGNRSRGRKEKRSEPAPKVVVLARDEVNGERFGFSIRGGSEHNVGIFVSSLDEGSVAEEAGLCLGDQIIEGNGMDFNDVPHKQAVEVIQQAVTLHLRVKSVGKIPGTFKSSSTYRWIDPSGILVSPPAEYSKANVGMREMNKSEMRLLGGEDERKVHLFVADGAELGLKIRGGVEFGIGIFIASVDEDSGADRAGFQVGDQILDVNGNSFLDISHKEAVEVLKNAQHMVITLKDIGILPHGKQIDDETSWIRDERLKTSPRSASTDTMKKKTETRKMPLFHESMGSSQLTHHSIVDHSDDILGVKARQVLSHDELQAFAFYLDEYRSTHLSLTSFLAVLSDLLQTRAKASLFQEIRSAILPRDLVKFDEWMEKSAENQFMKAGRTVESKLMNHDKQSLYSYKSSNSSTNSWFGLFRNGKHQRKKENSKNRKKEQLNSPKPPNETSSVGLASPINRTRNSMSSDEFPPPPKFITDNENSSDKLSASSVHSPHEPCPRFQETKNQSPVIQKSPRSSQVFGRTISPSDIQFDTPGLDNPGGKSNHLGAEEDSEDDTYACVNYRGTNGSSRNVPSGTVNARTSKVVRNVEDTEDGSYGSVYNWDTTGSSRDPYVTRNPLYSTPSCGDATGGSSNIASRKQGRKENKREIQMNGVRENMENQMPLYAVVDKSKMNKPIVSEGSKDTSSEEELELPPLIPERRYTQMEVVSLLGKDRKAFENCDLSGNDIFMESLNRNSTEHQNENSAPEAIASSTAPNVSINGQNDEPCIVTTIKSFPERLRQFDERSVLDDPRSTGSKERLRKSRKSRSRIVQEKRDQIPNEDRKTFVVELTKHTSNLGLSITGGTDTESKEIRIKSVKSENTVAGSCPLLKPGQIILAVDEKTLGNVTSGIAAMAIRQAFHSDKSVLKLIIDNGS